MFTNAGDRSGSNRGTRFLGIRLGNSSAQTLTTGTPTAITFNILRFNTFNFIKTSTKIFIPRHGFYRISGHITFVANATGLRRAVLMLNGATELDNISIASSGSVFTTQISLSTTVQLICNDYIELFARQDSGGNLDSSGGNIKEPALTVECLGLTL